MNNKCKNEQNKCAYIDRDLSWQKFNERALQQAELDDNPILERLNFSAIFTSNSDEFFEVRVGEALNRAISCQDRLFVKKLCNNYRAQLKKQENADKRILDELRKRKIFVCEWRDLNKDERNQARDFFKRNVIPHIFAHYIHKNQPMPFIENKGLGAIIRTAGVQKSNTSDDFIGYVIIISKQVPNYFRIKDSETTKILLTESLLMRYLPMTANVRKPYSMTLFRVIRNADIEKIPQQSSRSKKYRDEIKDLMKKRDKLSAVCLDFYSNGNQLDEDTNEYLRRQFGLKSYQIFAKQVSLSADWKKDLRHDCVSEYVGMTYKDVPKCGFNSSRILEKLRKKDILISYPYHSVDVYLDFLRAAVASDLTKSIKITLYRLGSKSEIVALLCAAAVKGIEVTAVIELRARFDEESNIRWSDVLENAGCKVIYGLPPYKVHAKVTLIEQYSDSQYAHIATGNYNETTSNLYTDLGILTSKSEICDDAAALFKNIEAGIAFAEYKNLLVAPLCLKKRIIDEIKHESYRGKEGYIFMKMNSLTDQDVISTLTEASKRGAKIDLIVRGICCLRPGVDGVTENIRVISIVGRYLEHSRIYIFGENAHIRRTYIGSADMMTRNTEKRVEVLTPVTDLDVAETIYKMTRLMLDDNKNASIMQNDGKYRRLKPAEGEGIIDSQLEMYNIY